MPYFRMIIYKQETHISGLKEPFNRPTFQTGTFNFTDEYIVCKTLKFIQHLFINIEPVPKSTWPLFQTAELILFLIKERHPLSKLFSYPKLNIFFFKRIPVMKIIPGRESWFKRHLLHLVIKFNTSGLGIFFESFPSVPAQVFL